MAKLLISTQVYENYGAHDWDGKGECPQYWKAKGGNDYVVKDIGTVLSGKFELAKYLVDSYKPEIETNNEYFHEYVISWEVVEDDYLTEFERSQLEYEGKITFGPKELVW